MGALHAGHASLVERCAKECDVTVVSLFVNPTQFNDPKDLANYPRTIENDTHLLEKMGAHYLFNPEATEIYADQYRYRVTENEFSKILCGAFRPGHFDGVLTVVLKLFNIIQPTHAYFGEKDFQQLKLIQEMCRTLFLDIKVIPCPTVRENDGLAMSSRNLLLTKEERTHAVHFPRLLTSNKSPEEIKTELTSLGFKVDYIVDRDGRRFGAVHLGKVRLIDNVRKN